MLARRSDSFTSGKSVPDTSGWVAVVYISTQRRTERAPAVVGIDTPLSRHDTNYVSVSRTAGHPLVGF